MRRWLEAGATDGVDCIRGRAEIVPVWRIAAPHRPLLRRRARARHRRAHESLKLRPTRRTRPASARMTPRTLTLLFAVRPAPQRLGSGPGSQSRAAPRRPGTRTRRASPTTTSSSSSAAQGTYHSPQKRPNRPSPAHQHLTRAHMPPRPILLASSERTSRPGTTPMSWTSLPPPGRSDPRGGRCRAGGRCMRLWRFPAETCWSTAGAGRTGRCLGTFLCWCGAASDGRVCAPCPPVDASAVAFESERA